MSRRVYVKLNGPELEALTKLAQAERRHPRDQGAVLLADALRRAGALSDATGAGQPSPGPAAENGHGPRV